VRVGTSGWQYRDWRGAFYPEGLAQRGWLGYYAGRFDTVESNAAFYRLPELETFRKWAGQVPDGFVMAVKASRYLTHVRRLADPEEPGARLLEHAAGLGDRLGPILVQLPPTLVAVPERLDATLAAFGGRVRVAVEPRHASWWTGEVEAILRAHGAALCWSDRRGRPVAPLWRTADWGYLRLHEGRAMPWPRYGRQSLRTWRDRIRDAWGPDAEAYVYFNNDQHAAAPHDAAHLIELASGGRGGG
jgi:uncharacterized protein YecE (DUF72 family)